MDKCNLTGVPRPHYLIAADISDDGKELKGIAVFPSSDPSIFDRKDHANVSHQLFALWNAAHLMARKLRIRYPLVRNIEVDIPKITRIDKEINLELKITEYTEKDRSVSGRFIASFSDNGRTLSNVKAQFKALKIRE